MFSPEQIIFAPTSRCNLACGHCRVARTSDSLDPDSAVAFMEDCREHGIEVLGYSGGEPFLEPGFLARTAAAAVRLDMRFDRLMTNGIWYSSPGEPDRTLSTLYDSGFDGTFGVSFDRWHGQDPERLSRFFLAAFRIWGRKDIAEIVHVRSEEDAAWYRDLRRLASLIGARVESDDGIPVALVPESAPRESRPPRMPGPDDGSRLHVSILDIPFSPPAGEARWDAGEWFRDDRCEGPGNVFYVHPDGRIAVCCGFANERPELVVGRLGVDGWDRLMANARSNSHVAACYTGGLGALRERLEREGVRFPGKLSDPCVLCDYLCAHGLACRGRGGA